MVKKTSSQIHEQPTIAFDQHVMKESLKFCTKEQAKAYGKMYRKMWKTADQDSKKELESECIQELMHLSVFGKPEISMKARLILEVFHDYKKFKAVDTMLCRLLEPFIWRGLKALNAKIRLNSAHLFFLLFPLRNNQLSNTENEQLLQRQIDYFEVLLNDAVPCIRIVSVLGACEKLDIYYQIIPSRCLKSIFELLVSGLAYDASSADVRAAVLKGMKKLTENPRSHSVMQKMLPKLSLCVHDSAEAVRLAFVQLLHKIKGSHFMRYWNVVSMNHLLARLVAEPSNVIKKLLVELILNSYCQENDSSLENRLSRFTFLIQTNLQAARTFFYYLPDFIADLKYLVDSILIMLRCVYSCVKNAKRSNDSISSSVTENTAAADEKSILVDSDSSATNTKNGSVIGSVILDPVTPNSSSDHHTALTVENMVVVCGLFECSAILWRQIGNRLTQPDHVKLYARLVKISSKIIQESFIFFDNKYIVDVLLDFATLFRPSAVPYLASSVFKKLKMIEDADYNDSNSILPGLLKAACFWRFNELADTILAWLRGRGDPECSTSVLSAVSGTPKTKRSRRIKFASSSKLLLSSDPKPHLALHYLEFLLNDHECRPYILREHRPYFAKFVDNIDDFLMNYNLFSNDRSDGSSGFFDGKINVNMILLAERLQASIRMILTLELKEFFVDDTATFLKSKIEFHIINTLPELKNGRDGQQGNAEKFILQFLLTLRHALMLNVGNYLLTIKILDFIKEITDHYAENLRIFCELSQLIFNVLDYLRYCEDPVFDVDGKIQPLVSNWCDRFVHLVRKDHDDDDDQLEKQDISKKSCYDAALETMELLAGYDREQVQKFAIDYMQRLKSVKPAVENKK